MRRLEGRKADADSIVRLLKARLVEPTEPTKSRLTRLGEAATATPSVSLRSPSPEMTPTPMVVGTLLERSQLAPGERASASPDRGSTPPTAARGSSSPPRKVAVPPRPSGSNAGKSAANGRALQPSGMISIEPDPAAPLAVESRPRQLEDHVDGDVALAIVHQPPRRPSHPTIPRPAPLPADLSLIDAAPAAHRGEAGVSQLGVPFDYGNAFGADYQPPRKPPQSNVPPPAALSVSVATEFDPQATTKPKVRRASGAPQTSPLLVGLDRMLAWGMVLGGFFVALIVVIVQLLIPGEVRRATQAATSQPESAQRADHNPLRGSAELTAEAEPLAEQSGEPTDPQAHRTMSPRRGGPSEVSSVASSSTDLGSDSVRSLSKRPRGEVVKPARPAAE